MKHMQYKGYLGSTEVSIEDGVLFGKLLFIRDLVTYEAETAFGLKAAFEIAVDEYISECIEECREPDKPFKGQFNVRITPQLHRSLAVAASLKEVSLNDYVETILNRHEQVDSSGHVKPDSSGIVVVVRETGRAAIFASMTEHNYGRPPTDSFRKTLSIPSESISKAVWNLPTQRTTGRVQ
jgi:predicted HicB family RNase H-like nuclease